MRRDRLSPLERLEIDRDPPRLPGPSVLDVAMVIIAILLTISTILLIVVPKESSLPYCADMGAEWLGWCRGDPPAQGVQL